MQVNAVWAGPRLRSAVRLTLGMGLAAVATIPVLLDIPRDRTAPLLIVGVLLTVALIASIVMTLRLEEYSRSAWLEVMPAIGLIIVLAVALVIPWEVFSPWVGDLFVIAFVVYYLVELRGVVKSHPAWYATLSLAGVVVLISLAMADVEAAVPGREISNAGQALLWASAQVLRAGSLVTYGPVTTMGAWLGFVIILSGVLFAAVLFSAITAWAVRHGHEEKGDSSRSGGDGVGDQVMRVLRDAGVIGPESFKQPDPLMYVDADWIVQRQKGGWWTSRERVTERYVARVRAGCSGFVPTEIIAVGHDAARPRRLDSRNRDPFQAGEGPVVEWAADPAGLILDRVRPGDTVVTGRRSLVERLAEDGVDIMTPEEFERCLSAAEKSARPTP